MGEEGFRFLFNRLLTNRLGRILVSAFASGGAKVISILFTLLTTPLILSYLGIERYGLWVTISSTFAFSGFVDLGIGFAIVNIVASAQGSGNWEVAKKWISSGFVTLVLVSLLLGFVFALVFPVIDWVKLFKLEDPVAINEVKPSIIIFVILSLLSIPLTIIQRIQLGLQQSYINSIWQALGYLLSIISLIVAINLRASLPILVFVLAGLPIISSLLNIIFFRFGKRAYLLPKVGYISMPIMKMVLSSGFLFLIRQLADTIGMQSDNIVITQIIGIQSVALYSVTSKLFSFIPMILNFLFMPLWPAYGEALSKGESIWIQSVFIKSMVIGMVTSIPLAVVLYFQGNFMIHIWVGEHISAPFMLLLSLSVWMILKGTFVSPLYVYLNGINKIGFQAICAICMAITNISLSIILTKYTGISGVVWGSIIAHLLCIVLPSLIFIKYLNLRQEDLRKVLE